MGIHSFVKRLSGLTHILETTFPAFYQVNDIAGFTRSVYFDGVGFANYFASKHTCGLQYGAGLATASTTWRIARCLIHTRRQSCVYGQMFKIFRESESDYGVIWWHLVV